MSRITNVSPENLTPEAKSVLDYARQGLAHITGRQTEHGADPFEALAHIPGVLQADAALETATAQLNGVEKRLAMLAQLKAATLTHCEYCIDIGSQLSRLSGLTDEELLALPCYEDSPLFTYREKLVLDYAVGVSSTPVDVSDELFAALKEQFTDAQIVELTHLIAMENMRGRFNHALDIGSAGFSEGMVCAVPASTTAVAV